MKQFSYLILAVFLSATAGYFLGNQQAQDSRTFIPDNMLHPRDDIVTTDDFIDRTSDLRAYATLYKMREQRDRFIIDRLNIDFDHAERNIHAEDINYLFGILPVADSVLYSIYRNLDWISQRDISERRPKLWLRAAIVQLEGAKYVAMRDGDMALYLAAKIMQICVIDSIIANDYPRLENECIPNLRHDFEKATGVSLIDPRERNVPLRVGVD